MNRLNLLFFLLLLSSSLEARTQSNLTRADIDRIRRELGSEFSPTPVDIAGTGLMVIGSGLLIPYTCFPDVNNPKMTHMKKAACSGSIIYFVGQTMDWCNKIYEYAVTR